MRLPWKPIYDRLNRDLFLTRRQFEYTYVLYTHSFFPIADAFHRRQLSWCMGYIAESSRKFFHPAAINDMLSNFLPLIDGTRLDVGI